MRTDNIGCLFWGGVGTGKSYLAGCIANALMEKEIPVHMTNFALIGRRKRDRPCWTNRTSPCLRRVLSFCDAVLAAVQEVNLVNPLPVAHLHDFGFEVAQGSIGTAVLAPGFRVGWPVHVG